MQGGAGRRTGLSARRAQRTKSRGYNRPRQTVADQSILKYAVLPASPMPLLHDTMNKESMGELIVQPNDALLFCTVSPTDAQTVGYFYCIVLDIVQDSLSIILSPDLNPFLCLFLLQIKMVTIYVNN